MKKYPKIARFARGVGKGALEWWHSLVPTLLCILGGVVYAADAAPGWARFVGAVLLWGWSLDLVRSREAAKVTKEMASAIWSLIVAERDVSIAVEHSYRADEETLAALRAGREVKSGV